MMDAVLGHKNYRNEVVWHYSNLSATRKHFPRKHDIIFRYTLSENWTFNADDIRIPYAESSKNRVQYKGSGFAKKAKGSWINSKGKIPDTVWEIPLLKGKEREGYPTQKPLALLDRIIKASSNPNDLILGPFCSCATTCVAAERLQRQWIDIDLSVKAVELVRTRLEKEMGMFYDVDHRTDIPHRTVPDALEEIKPQTLFPFQDPISATLSQIELRQYKTYKHTLFGLQEGKCNGCQVLLPFRNLTIDHIVPRSQGGTNHSDNLQLLCAACNSTKGDRTQEYLIQKLKESGDIGIPPR